MEFTMVKSSSKARMDQLPRAALPARLRKLRRGDSILGITKPAIRRLARRGGVKHIEVSIYETMRQVLKERLREILQKICWVLDTTGPQGVGPEGGPAPRKTITSEDVVFVLKRYMNSPLYGFEGNKVVTESGNVRRLNW